MKDCCNNPNDSRKVSEISKTMKIISEPNRLKVLCLLKKGTKCVCEIQKNLKLPQNLLSHHLKVLKGTGLIDFEKRGQWKYYFLNSEALENFTNIFSKIFKIIK